MTAVVVDTNVAVVANEAQSRTPTRPLDCVLTCVRELHEIMAGGHVVVDSLGLILAEYLRNLNIRGQPGVGDEFAKWVHDHQFDTERCRRVDLSPIGGSEVEFAEFPNAAGLDVIDPDDRKFIAVAAAYPDEVAIVQATDTKWWGWAPALDAAGVKVRFLCPEFIREAYEARFGER